MSATLYISYTGMLEPLGQSQVIAYQAQIAQDRPVCLVSFERKEDLLRSEEVALLHQRLRDAGISWFPRVYHKRPSALATLWDILVGTVLGSWLVLRHRVVLVHARSYVAGVMALAIRRLTGRPFVFDMRGFWADERVDGGLWPRNGRMYRVAKWFERKLLLSTAHVVSLTHAAVREMQAFPHLQGRIPPMTVIPTCADLDRFRPIEGKRSLEFTLGYVGSVGTWYLFDATVAAFAELLRLRPEARLLIVNRGSHAYIRERLLAGGVPLAAVELIEASHDEMPLQIARMHAGVFFIKPLFSKQASAPTKLGEFLGCGVPCLANSGVGDMEAIIENGRVGVAIDRFDPSALKEGLERLLALTADPQTSTRCVMTAREYFSLDRGVEMYRRTYAAVIAGRTAND